MKIPRINIYLKFTHIFSTIFDNYPKSKLNIEAELKKKLNKKFIFLTGMCRSSFIFVLEYLKIKYPKKNEILMCSYNLQEMVEIAINKNFSLKLVDIDPLDGVMSINSIKNSINEKTVCIIFTNMFNDSDILEKLRVLCKSRKIMFIEDNAIYLGNYTKKNDKIKYAGSYGDVSLLSFGIMKNYSAIDNNWFSITYSCQKISSETLW